MRHNEEFMNEELAKLCPLKVNRKNIEMS